ncbi:MAG: CBS domain-containing protein [Nitrospirae bacterium]|nr:CBS domain-containing protein [Candidatus Manganitrophaceae bacterium]
MRPKFGTIGQIKKGNPLYAREGSSAFDVATRLLDTGHTGMPVIDETDRVIGVVSEQDILRALRGSQPLETLQVNEIMTPIAIVVDETATLEEASEAMEDLQIHRLPVVRGEKLVGTITRHDLIRAWLGLNVEAA